MKCLLLLSFVSISIKTIAQQNPGIIKDTLPAKMVIKNNVLTKKAAAILSVEATIENELNKIVAAYTNQPNTAATWIQVKQAADNLLYQYFKTEKLMGTKREQAYYIKMGTETMTATDIANHKMILIAGIATIKPAEFIMIRIEKTCTQ
ncbi:hypothetical protein [Ferruginibacter sp. SUN106]|uniref:hypothetical protein n=1 Tax=Ferruginibacter sp. SUN106 TaxID=2978348 RepID=UPI003D35C633